MRTPIRLVALAMALGIMATSSHADRRATVYGRGGRGARVDVVGDSLVRQIGPELLDRLEAAGYQFSVASMPAQDLASSFVQQQLDALERHPGDVLVVATAANDAIRDADRAARIGDTAAALTYEGWVRRTVERFHDRCVVMVNAREDVSAIYDPEHARTVNARLRLLEREHPNLVVVDWAGGSRRVPSEDFAPDHLHFGPDPAVPAEQSGSARRYADAIIEGIRACPA